MKRFTTIILLLGLAMGLFSQTSTEFWFAPPEVTSGHVTDLPINLRIATGNSASTVTIDQPALGAAAFAGAGSLVYVIPANSQVTIDLSPYQSDLETFPTDSVLNTGLHIVATNAVTAYYELNTNFNPEIFALKGANGLGLEFYTPFNIRYGNDLGYNPDPYKSFDIVATEDSTTVLIYPRKPLDGGHPALTSYSVSLNRGQTYSGSVTSFTGSDAPAGTAIVSDKPIAVSVKDDSAEPAPWGSCRDLLGDQIVPVDIIGAEYIAQKGFLDANIERFFITAVANGTEVTIDGVLETTLFAGETYDYQLDDAFAYITTNHPVYAFHVSGFGCEMGAALLPPLNCAGSEQVSFVRSQADPRLFALSVLIRTGGEGDFEIDGNATLLQASDFSTVPNTGGAWMGAQVTYSDVEMATGVAHQITNSSDVFTLGIINGGTTTGCRFGYFSEFSAEILIDAGSNQIICATDSAFLSGSVTGGTTTGEWSTSGTGIFIPDDQTLNATYIPSSTDIATGFATLTLSSTGACYPVTDDMAVTFSPAPTADAGTDITSCANNTTVTLNGVITVATGSTWTGGAGTYNPNNTTLNATYTPSTGEVTGGTVTLTLTTTGNGNCNPVTDDVIITIAPSPIAAAGVNQISCANNADVTLAGSITNATGGIWSGGGGSFNPNTTALNAVYTPSVGEIAAGIATLILTTTGNGNCLAESDSMSISINTAPVVNAGNDQTICENNADFVLNGSITNATGGQWTGGLGTFNPDANTLNATYSPTAPEIASGTLTLTLTSTGNGLCNAESNDMTVTFTASPTANAGVDLNSCANNSDVTLNGTVTVATGGAWTGGGGSYNPNNTTLNAVYTPSAAEALAGTATLTLTSTGNGNCNSVSDDVIITIDPSPIVNAGTNQTSCANNPNVILTGSVTNATGGVWTGGTGSYNPSATALNVVYTPSVGEIAVGSVTLTLTSTGNGNCNVVSDNVTITISASPIVSAGSNQNICENNPDIVLNGSVIGATGVLWTGGLGSFNPDATTLNATYTPTATEIASGTLTLTLTSTGNGSCNAESAAMTVTFSTAPTVDAGIDLNSCANNSNVTLNGAITIASGGVWTGGSGTYNPNNTDLNATYTPSSGEISSGAVTLTLTTTGIGNCTAVTDDVIITIAPLPISDAGIDQSSCANNPSVTLAGVVTNASGGIWTGGAGPFNNSTTQLDAIYTPSAAEIAAGTVTLTLTTIGNGTCNAESDDLTITITNSPTANAGVDQSICENNPDVILSGSVTIATGGQWTGGLGSFNPDANTLNTVYTPTATEIASGSLILTLRTTGNGVCSIVTDKITLTFTSAPTVDAGPDLNSCANNPDVTLNGAITVASGGVWTGGSGTYSPNNTDLNAVYTPSSSEITAGTVTLMLTSTGNGNCTTVTDDVVIVIDPSPIVSAGVNQSSCANNPSVTLAGIISNATGAVWSGGSGSFNPNTTDLNAIYTPSAGEIAVGTVSLTLTTTGNGNCIAETDAMVLTITQSPTINAGIDQTICENNADIILNGGVTIASGGQWTGGLGSFNPDANSLNTTYTPTATEIASGNLTLTLTTTGNGGCNAVSDDMSVTFTSAPTADAGPDLNSCANNPDVTLNGTITIATGGVWTGGSGTYNPNNTDLNAIYTPSSGEISTGTVTLMLTSTGNGNCTTVTDDVVITIASLPIADAGSNQTSCANNPNVTLSGSVTNATGGVWSGGAGSFNPNTTDLNAIYTPSAGEIAAGTVTLTLTSTGNGSCNSENDNMTISITSSPTANAGVDQTICENNADIVLNGSVTIASGGQWTGGLGSFNPNANSLNATYTPTATEIASGTLTLTLTTTGNGGCNAVSDDMAVTFTSAPTADAGPDLNSCANNPDVNLNGTITIATGGVWTGGSGTYNPNNTDLNAVYTPSSSEITAGTVTLMLTSTGNGNCTTVTDDVVITIVPSPITDAGSNQTSCANNPDVALSGSIINATGGVWSGGAGSFNPNTTDLNAIYTPSAGEIAAGTVTLTLTTTGNGSCNSENDNITINITLSPIANAGVDQTICENNADIILNASVTIASGGQWTGGLGSFSPNANSLNATYTPTATEKASGNLTLTLTTTGNGGCNAVSDDMSVTFTAAPTADAGPDLNSCANNAATTLNGTITIASGGIWTGGSGTYNPNNTDLNAIYTPSSGEISAGSVTLTLTTTGNGNCLAVIDDVTIIIADLPIANAGPNLTSCANNPDVNLAGLVTNATGGIWSGGAGIFIPNSLDLNAIYTPSAGEIIAGTVTLTLTTTGNGNCNPNTDDMVISILAAPVADAGVDQTVCENNADVVLSGSVNNAAGGQWTGGLGLFTPDANSLNTVYTPTANEIASGTLTLTLTTTGNGTCNAELDNMTVTFSTAPTADAGPDLNSCANNSAVSLNGTVTVATGGQWSGGSGTYNPNNTDLNAAYTPSTTEINNGSVTLTLSSTGNGICAAVTDNVLITIDQTPTVDAGIDQNICVNNLMVVLAGSVSGITNTGVWSTAGSGFFVPNNSTLNATYIASSADSIVGSVVLTLQSTNNGTCLPITNQMTINITPAGAADAGLDATVCANNSTVTLSGSTSGGSSGGTWSTTGTGVFFPSNTDLNATYTPSAFDVSQGSASITLTANSCNVATDDMVITITPEPVVSAGSNQTVCGSNLNIALSGSVSGASNTGVWTTSGTGSFSPSNTDLNATYIASSGDSLAQGVTLNLRATNVGTCLPVFDTIRINIFPAGSVNAGADQNLCANNADVILSGVISGGATKGQWTSTGTGVFIPNDTTLNATYIPSSDDTLAGTINLILAATNSCNSATDFLVVNITPAPSVEAGASQVICATNPVTTFNGTVLGATGGRWSTAGSGTFLPNVTDMTVNYTASPQDIIDGAVFIYLTSTGNGNCNAVIDSLELSFSSGISVNAGSDQNVCSNSAVMLQGSVTSGSTTGIWTTMGTGTFIPNDSTLNAEYNYSGADSAAGTVTLVLTSINNGNCAAETDTMNITFGLPVSVNVGADIEVCVDNMNVNLNGIISGGSSTGIWTTLGNGTFVPNDTTLNAVYLPGVADSIAQTVSLVLTTTNNGSCQEGSDTLTVTITPVPTVNAGIDQVICAGTESIFIRGTVSNVNGFSWTTTGTGSFSPSDTTLNASYTPSQQDMATGQWQIIISSTDDVVCSSVSDTLEVSVLIPVLAGFEYEEGCVDFPISFTDTSEIFTGTITSYNWNFGDGENSSAQNPNHNFSNSGSFDVTLTVTSSLGCVDSVTQSVVVHGYPLAGFNTSDNLVIDELIQFMDASVGAEAWLWNFDDGLSSSTDQDPSYTYTEGGEYNVIQIVTSQYGCTDTAQINLDIDDTKVYPPVLPTGFTPNEDGENDILIVRGGPFLSVDLKVYNNWGNLVFESNDPAEGWDGTWKGKLQPDEDYIYIIYAVTIDGEEYHRTGSIAIIR